jgi:hypothetical protein
MLDGVVIGGASPSTTSSEQEGEDFYDFERPYGASMDRASTKDDSA